MQYLYNEYDNKSTKIKNKLIGYDLIFYSDSFMHAMVEARGVEPLSEKNYIKLSTSVASCLNFLTKKQKANSFVS